LKNQFGDEPKRYIDTRSNVMEDNKTYLKRIADKLVEWDAKIEDLKKKGNEASALVREDYLKIAEDLKTKKQLAEEQIKQLKANSGEGWEEIKKGADKAINDLTDAVDKALLKFKKKAE
jgi:hypothetical protein